MFILLVEIIFFISLYLLLCVERLSIFNFILYLKIIFHDAFENVNRQKQ